MVRHLVLALAATLAAVPAAIGANDRPDGSGPAVRRAMVSGHAWTAENAPIPAARLRLRNLSTGKAAAVAVADERGEFRFAPVDAGSYVVELVNEAGHVVAVGHPFSIAAGDAVATFVRLSTRVPWFTGFFSNAAAVVTSSAASQGITALTPVARPASAGR